MGVLKSMERTGRKFEWQFAEPYQRVSLAELPIHHPVKVFADHWLSKCATGSPMSRSDFSPEELPQVIPWLMILESTENAGYRYRLCGTGCVRLFGIDYTNCELGDHLPEESVETRRQEFAEVWRGSEPVYSHTRVPIPGREFVKICRGVFPVATPEGHRNQIFVVIAPAELGN